MPKEMISLSTCSCNISYFLEFQSQSTTLVPKMLSIVSLLSEDRETAPVSPTEPSIYWLIKCYYNLPLKWEKTKLYLELPVAITLIRGCNLLTGQMVVMLWSKTCSTSWPVLISIKSIGCNATPWKSSLM
jgi:hypothetical protein